MIEKLTSSVATGELEAMASSSWVEKARLAVIDARKSEAKQYRGKSAVAADDPDIRRAWGRAAASGIFNWRAVEAVGVLLRGLDLEAAEEAASTWGDEASSILATINYEAACL